MLALHIVIFADCADICGLAELASIHIASYTLAVKVCGSSGASAGSAVQNLKWGFALASILDGGESGQALSADVFLLALLAEGDVTFNAGIIEEYSACGAHALEVLKFEGFRAFAEGRGLESECRITS